MIQLGSDHQVLKSKFNFKYLKFKIRRKHSFTYYPRVELIQYNKQDTCGQEKRRKLREKILKACLGDTQKGKAEMLTTKEEEEMDKENKSNLNLPLKRLCYRAAGPFPGRKGKRNHSTILCFALL